MDWIAIENEGLVATGRIVAIGQVDAAPIRRLVQKTPEARVVILTGGQKRQTVLVLDSGHVVITPLTVAALMDLLRNESWR